MPRSVPLTTQSWIQISQMPPDIPLPIATAACPPIKRQFFTSICSQGRPTRHPSSFMPELIAMQSSPVSKVQSSISTFLHESGLQPSVFGPLVFTVTPRTTTSSQYTGWIVHCGPSSIVKSSNVTCLQFMNWMNEGRSASSLVANTRSSTTIP